jgi:hypothetical protein
LTKPCAYFKNPFLRKALSSCLVPGPSSLLSFFSQACFQISPNLDSVLPFSNTLSYPAYPEMKFSSAGICFDNFCEAFFRSSEHGSVLVFIPFKYSVNLNYKSCQLPRVFGFLDARCRAFPKFMNVLFPCKGIV